MKFKVVVLALVWAVVLLVIGAAAGFYMSGLTGASPAATRSGGTSQLTPSDSAQAGMAQMAGMNTQGQESAGGTAQGKTIYYCPMHPSYTSDKPGECPICNMALVPMKKPEAPQAASAVEGHATVTISPAGQQLIGVQTGLATKQAVKKLTRAVGTVVYNERGLSSVNLKFSGWVEKLFVKATGEAVHKGDALMEVYSPEFLEAQRNYLLAIESAGQLTQGSPEGARAFADRSIQAARERLLLWDVTPEQIKEIEQSKEPKSVITILSRAEGIVIARNVVEGTSVEAGKDLFQIADLSTVWIEADLYEYEIPLVKTGDRVKVTLASYPGEEITGAVTYIYPYLNDKTRSVRVRFEVPNPEGKLKPGMYATVNLESDLGKQLVVDEGAVLDTGVRQIVFVARGNGVFEPREVAAGQRVDGKVVILKGLKEGESIVTSGNFLVDSESRLKSAASGAGMPGMPGMEMPSGSGQGGMENMPGMGTQPAGQEKPAEEKGMENMPGMGAPSGKEEKTMEGMPGMGQTDKAGSTDSMEGMPGMGQMDKAGSTDSMEGMPGM